MTDAMGKYFTTQEHMFQFVRGWASWAEDKSDAIYEQAIQEGVHNFNVEFGRHEPTDCYVEFMEWLANENHT